MLKKEVAERWLDNFDDILLGSCSFEFAFVGDLIRLFSTEAHEETHVACMTFGQNHRATLTALHGCIATAAQVRIERTTTLDLAGRSDFETLDAALIWLVLITHGLFLLTKIPAFSERGVPQYSKRRKIEQAKGLSSLKHKIISDLRKHMNPNVETRNPNQIRKPNDVKTCRSRSTTKTPISDFVIRARFGFLVSTFGFTLSPRLSLLLRYKNIMPLEINSNQTLLFIGDSITDCGRRNDPEGIGSGFVRIIRDYLYAKNPASAPRVINTGISGNKVTDLAKRWKTDVIDYQPDVLTIKIGINDVWHGLNPNNPNGVAIEQFVEVYHVILRQVQGASPKTKIVLCQPSVIDPPSPAEGNQVLQPYVRAVNELKREFGAVSLVPLHNIFVNARKNRPEIAWTTDGVHPTSAGHMLIARAWLAETGLL